MDALPTARYAREQEGPEAPIVVPDHYIVEFESSASGARQIKNLQTHRDFDVLEVFDGDRDLFFGATVKTTEDGVASLASEPAVIRSWPLTKFKLNTAIDLKNYRNIAGAGDYNIHGQTGVQDLHDRGILGQGALLGGGIGPDFTVVGGVDLPGDGCWPKPGCEREEDDDPMDFNGHGTHVAGIIAGKSEFFTGVAPEAKLRSYKGIITDAILIESMMRAYTDGVDIISASIGGVYGWQDSPWAVVADRLVDRGVVVVMAAGNYGDYGAFLGSDGSYGKNVLAVAATEPSHVAQQALLIDFISPEGRNESAKIGHESPYGPFPLVVEGWPIVSLGSGCDQIPNLNLDNKIALVGEGPCTTEVKEGIIGEAGGVFALQYKQVADGLFGWNSIWGAQISDDAGQSIHDALQDGYEVLVTSPNELVIVGEKHAAAGAAAIYTSFGPSFELGVKPDIAAPGSQILSTWLEEEYALLSGTSMATPYITGVAALYVGEFGGRSKYGADFAKMLQSRIVASGEHVPWRLSSGKTDDDGAASVAQVGNGLVNATKVLDSHTQLSFTKFALNDTHHFSRYQGLEITNQSPDTVTYTFDVVDSGAVEALEWYNGHPLPDGYPQLSDKRIEIAPKVRLPAGTQRLAPGQTKKVEFVFTIPDGMTSQNLPIYSGKVFVKGSNGDQLSVPYLGVGTDIHDTLRKNTWAHYNGYPDIVVGNDWDSIEEHNRIAFKTDLNDYDYPYLMFMTHYGTREMRWDIFEQGWKEHQWKYPPVPGKDGYVGSVAAWNANDNGLLRLFDPSKHDLDDVTPFPFLNHPRAVAGDYFWLGRLANGSNIAPGKYNMRLAVLVPFGDPHASDNWDTAATPLIEIFKP
ncbi:subtilisin-like protein [Sarocladium strictum]